MLSNKTPGVGQTDKWMLPPLTAHSVIIFLIIAIHSVFQASDLVRANEDVQAIEHILKLAREAERKQNFDHAIALYQKIMKESPDVKFEGEIQSGKYSDLARDRISVLSCRKNRGPDFSTKTPQEFTELLKKALAASSHDLIIKYASCDFIVGPIDSDNTWSLVPDKAVPIILQHVHSFDFPSSRSEQMVEGRWVLEFSDINLKDRHRFQIKKKGDKWAWTYFGTSSSSILDALFAPKKSS